MARAWNAGNGAEFACYCDEDADFVNIYGMHARGRQAIAEGHDHIFRTVYAGSRIEYTVSQIRFLREDVALVHLRAGLRVPQGPLAGEMTAVPGMVMQRTDSGWRVAAFQNTLVGNPPVQN
jgi:uncharacterized protein (TIGR02246 family)